MEPIEGLLIKGTDEANFIVGSAGDDTIKGAKGDDTLIGGEGNDLLNGGKGDDPILGEAGDDTLFGSQGADTLSGGEGNDVFIFSTKVDGATDKIRNFEFPTEQGGDLLIFSRIDADTSTAENQEFLFSDDGPAANSLWVQNTNKGHVKVSYDVDGDAVADASVVLIDRQGTLVAQDFAGGDGLVL
jgi:Ca2+-binding RTX toxin-like protein